MIALHDSDGAPVIIGGGLAGLMTALALAPQPVLLLTGAPLGLESSSVLAQGGIAAGIGADDDASLHLEDTLAAGDGLCDEAVAAALLAAAPAAIEALVRLGVVFDRDAGDNIALGLEAAHSRRRIVHAGGDATGRDMIRALIRKVYETPSITVIEATTAQRLVVEDNAVTGVLGHNDRGPVFFVTDRVVIATGGIGGLFLHGTNPAGSFGQGLALAARAGAVMADLEFIQFHPTALDNGSFPQKLISEAVRGEGAILIDEKGDRFMADVPGAELAPRDIVARAVWRHMSAGHRVFLDARNVRGLDFARRFPAITALCREAGIDPVTQTIPVRPAAHYHMAAYPSTWPGEPRSMVSGLAAKPPAPACMVQTGSPAIRCLRRRCAAAGLPEILPRRPRSGGAVFGFLTEKSGAIQLQSGPSCRAPPACCATAKACARPLAPSTPLQSRGNPPPIRRSSD